VDNLFHSNNAGNAESPEMNGLTGMEKFSHLEDKIYLTLEFVKKLRDEKEKLERESADLRKQAAEAIAAKEDAESRLSQLNSEREVIQSKVEAMLDAITALDPEIAEAAAAR
jgi:FtsZ-binding cell division protein ZapB